MDEENLIAYFIRPLSCLVLYCIRLNRIRNAYFFLNYISYKKMVLHTCGGGGGGGGGGHSIPCEFKCVILVANHSDHNSNRRKKPN